MLAFPLTQVTSTVWFTFKAHCISALAHKLMDKISHTHAIENVHANTNMPHRQKRASISVCEGDRPVCEAVLETVLRFGTS